MDKRPWPILHEQPARETTNASQPHLLKLQSADELQQMTPTTTRPRTGLQLISTRQQSFSAAKPKSFRNFRTWRTYFVISHGEHHELNLSDDPISTRYPAPSSGYGRRLQWTASRWWLLLLLLRHMRSLFVLPHLVHLVRSHVVLGHAVLHRHMLLLMLGMLLLVRHWRGFLISDHNKQ